MAFCVICCSALTPLNTGVSGCGDQDMGMLNSGRRFMRSRLRHNQRCQQSNFPSFEGLQSQARVPTRLPRHLFVPLTNTTRSVLPSQRGGVPVFSAVVAEVALGEQGPLSWISKGTFRFWIDETILPGKGRLVERALLENGGTRTGCAARITAAAAVAPENVPGSHELLLRTNADPATLGCNHVDEWDILWSTYHFALAAVSQLKPGQVTNAMPGLSAITDRLKLAGTLVQVYGQGKAFAIMPPTFALPRQLDDWLRWLRQLDVQEEPEEQDRPPWLLKGELLQAVPAESTTRAVEKLRENRARCPILLAQQMVSDPMLIDGLAFHLQVWLLVTGTEPLRAYLHRNGLVYFSNQRCDPASLPAGPDGAVPPCRNSQARSAETVWNMYQLERALGAARFSTMWGAIQQACARVVAAALGPLVSQSQRLGLPPSATFQLLGAEFMVDSGCRPWLIKVQGSPSLDVRHRNPGLMALVNDQKARLAKDTVSMALCRMAGASGGVGVSERRELDRGVALAERELQALGAFQPLMGLFPIDARQAGARIPWQRVDHTFQAMLAAP